MSLDLMRLSKEELAVEIERLKDEIFEKDFELSGLRVLKEALPKGDEETERFLIQNKLCPHCLWWKRRIRILTQDKNEDWKCKACGSVVPKGPRFNKVLKLHYPDWP